MATGNHAVLKALDILDLLAQTKAPLPLKEIARRLEQPESSAHRLLASLTAKGYVQQRDPNGPYSLGWKVVLLARALQPELRLTQELRPCLEDLVRQLKHTVNLGVLNGARVLYLDCLVPDQSMSLYTPPGLSVPAHATALGKCLLAHLPAGEREAAVERLDLAPSTPTTITDRAELLRALEEIRERGYAVDASEFVRGVTCVAVPVKDLSGRAVAAISTTARSVELLEGWAEDTAARMIAAVRDHVAPDVLGGTLYVADPA